jgi:hypothetical protein
VGLIKRHARRIRRKIRDRSRDAFRGATDHWCPECQKRVRPFHLCAPKPDFRQRRAQSDRLAKRRTAKRKTEPRERRPPHPYQSCTDQECPRPACTAFRDGLAACPLEHK